MRVAVTGGSGIVGAAVVRHLVAAGHEVRGLTRTEASAGRIAALGGEPIPGDVLAPESLGRLVSGVDRVFHIAGVNEMCSIDAGHMDRVNIVGTANVRDACRAAGVNRLIHTSSAVAIGEEEGAVGSETTPHRGWYLSRYERSKHLSEQLLLETSAGLDVVCVNPSSVQGPGRASGTGRLILDALRGKLPFLVETTISIIDIDDCARGHLLAADRGQPGARYLLSGATLTMGEALTLLARVGGLSSKPRFLPGSVVSALAGVVEVGARALGRRPPVCREMVRALRHGHRYDGTRATRELGLGYLPVEETVQRTIDWFRAQGLLQAAR
ncbi:MAG TPA: NAD-dependent epimerase/dehydratase family protein [Acidimicrobiia bacterium]|nr:NAD-dependent epimerase/dehydratase family protein [Acidimicrobiia bacterium]